MDKLVKNKCKWDEKGFTIIELLLVLSIVMVVSSSVILLSSSRLEEMEEERFYKQLHMDIQRIQAISIGESKYTYLHFINNRTSYQAKSANVTLFEKEFPKNMRLADESTIKTISFHPNGNLNNFGNLLFETERGEKRITIYIGRGVINYEK